MAAELVIKAKNTFPYVEATLEQYNPSSKAMEPINLTGAHAVKMKWKVNNTIRENTCEVVNAAKGEVLYKQSAIDFETVGNYEVEWEIEWETGKKIESVPNEGTNTIEVQPVV